MPRGRGLYTRWTPALDSDLEQRWRAGDTAEEIAAAMGLRSRNAVIGRVNKLGLHNLPGRRRGRKPKPGAPEGDVNARNRARTDRSHQRRFVAIKPTGRPAKNLRADHPALLEGRTLFPKRVFHATVLPRLLKSGHNSRKTGKIVMKGRWKGFPIFTLTLEERATCPRSCGEWATCYGSNMQYAERIIADEIFEERLWAELGTIQAQHPEGFVVRLHILGDFYSADYAAIWVAALDHFPALRVFGYTARSPFDEIGSVLFAASAARWDRFAIRFSGAGFRTMCSEVVSAPDDATGFLCPAQTGATDCCATCALCWQTDSHRHLPPPLKGPA